MNSSLYVNAGASFKVGELSTEPYKGLKKSLNYGFGGFAGFKHNSGIELSIQGDLPIINSNGKTGIILNIKYGLFSAELGLSNLYSSFYKMYETSIISEWKTAIIAGRFNIIELISKLGIIRKLSRFIDLQILLRYDFKSGRFIPSPEFNVGLFEKYNGVLEKYNNIGKILKSNTIEYGNNKAFLSQQKGHSLIDGNNTAFSSQQKGHSLNESTELFKDCYENEYQESETPTKPINKEKWQIRDLTKKSSKNRRSNETNNT